MLIRSRANPLVRKLRALRRGPAGDTVLLEGWRLVQDALRSRIRVEEAVASPEWAETHPERAAALRARGAALHRVAAEVLASVSALHTSDGVLAVAKRPRFTDGEILRAPALVLVAAAVQDPGNLGGLLRSAEAAGATGAFLLQGCADALSWKALRGSMGSALRLPHRGGLAWSDLAGMLRRAGVRVLALDTGGEASYEEIDYRGPVAVAVGGEGPGLPPELRLAAQARLRIPMAGPVESLNVGVAAALVLFEAARQRRHEAAPLPPD
jgi:TrmH family RNA methyltransferase